MSAHNEKIPDPKELEKEIGEFLSKKFGGHVKLLSPMVLTQEAVTGKPKETVRDKRKIQFNLKPEDLIAYLDQYVVKQDQAKAILATKICTHFNRIRRTQEEPDQLDEMAGGIKNNVLMIGPTGVGKTYIIKLIAAKLGVPFVKGDATKFSETGYVGGDVEDLVRDLVREANDDIELAQHGIIYIDEIDKIASAKNLIGADVSRTGVQRALLKPMEETDVDLKVPHDPISMMQEIERFRKTGKRERVAVNTKNVLFIMSGAFTELIPIIQRRLRRQGIGFGARIASTREDVDILKHVKAEDLIEFGFESEFVGRIPVKAVFDPLGQEDLYQILKNPNNPIVLGKKLDFSAYGIQIKFEDAFLRRMAELAFAENTGARGLVSVIEKALLDFERALPSSAVKQFGVTLEALTDPAGMLQRMRSTPDDPAWRKVFERLADEEKASIKDYLQASRKGLTEKFSLTMTPARIDIVASYYVKHVLDTGNAVRRIKGCYDEIKNAELYFFKNHDINIVLEEDAIDFLMEMIVESAFELKDVYPRLNAHFEHGLKLVREKTGRSRFFISRNALINPEDYIRAMITAAPAQG
ncbi:MAG: AAA family ATPase [Desulfobacterales bacterium]|jgi:endopeptidase Clp ATP-binding regulatory subunit ClpX|nr:AAA family ATPase [Desulfobacterales bacterium]